MKAFSEHLRYEYNLNPDSIVIDGGGYEGNWFKTIWEKYHCNIHVFEPIGDFYMQCSKLATSLEAGPDRKIKVYNDGLWSSDTWDSFSVRGDTSGAFTESSRNEIVHLTSASDVVSRLGHVDVMKLNIEGSEYEVLEWLFDTALLKRIDNIQVQFHFNFPEAKRKYPFITNLLSQTHRPEWDSEPTWQNWVKK